MSDQISSKNSNLVILAVHVFIQTPNVGFITIVMSETSRFVGKSDNKDLDLLMKYSFILAIRFITERYIYETLDVYYISRCNIGSFRLKKGRGQGKSLPTRKIWHWWNLQNESFVQYY